MACRIAGYWDAEIHGLVILDTGGIEGSIGPVPLGADYYASRLEKHRIGQAESRIKALLASFRNTCTRARVRHRQAELQGSPAAHEIGARPCRP